MTDVPALRLRYEASFAAAPNAAKDVRPRSFAFETYVGNDAPVQEINDILDKMREALERQCAIYDLEIARDALANHLKNLRQLESASLTVEEVARLRWQEQGRKGEWDPERHLSSQEKTARKQNEGSLKSWREGAMHWDAEVRRLAEIVHADDISPDRGAGQPDR
jgi:hypothetical protein